MQTLMFFDNRTETALIYDAVQLFGKALTDLDKSQVMVKNDILWISTSTYFQASDFKARSGLFFKVIFGIFIVCLASIL